MYDLQTHARNDPRSTPPTAAAGGAPSMLLTAAEPGRWVGEYAAGRLLDLLPPVRRIDDARPVLVLPGFAADDRMTTPLRRHLRRAGFTTHGWRLGRNVGLTDQLVDGVLRRFDEVAARDPRPVSLVGWSFGGVWARWLAHQRPERVRQVVCLGSPWRADGERTRATAMFERSRRRHGISARAEEMVEQWRGPLPVPVTAVWSRTDGVVPWRGCLVEPVDGGPPAENVAVVSSHVGLVANPLVQAVVVDRLAQDPASWRPFSWRACLTPLPTSSPGSGRDRAPAGGRP